MFRNESSPAFAGLVMLVSLLTAYLLQRMLPLAARTSRNEAIDGIRGYLALGVLMSHGVIWFGYLRSGVWRLPNPSIYSGMGATCVAMFFMITAYLFIGKLLDARQRPINWAALYASRLLRITPLYLLSVLVLFFLIAALSKWKLHESPHLLFISMLHWLGYTMLSLPDVNGVTDSGILMARVSWSLAYEWLFYLSLPLLALMLRVRVSITLVLACAATLLLLLANKPDVVFHTAFLKGAIAAVVARHQGTRTVLRHRLFSVVLLLAMLLGFFAQHLVSARVHGLSVFAAFILLACGNAGFGVFSNRLSIYLGEISYGIYLLHGLTLAMVFLFVIDLTVVRGLEAAQHWMVVAGATVVVIIASALSFRFIESPAMMQVAALTAWIERLLPQRLIGAMKLRA